MSSRDFIVSSISLFCLVSSVVVQTTQAERHEVDHSLQPLDEKHDTVNIEGGKCNKCGQSHEEKEQNATYLIVDGKNVTPANKYPWMVAIVDPFREYIKLCAGVILNEYYILTSANCLIQCSLCGNYDPEDILVEFIAPPPEAMVVSNRSAVAKIISHPDYSLSERSTHDLGLLKLVSPIECDSYKSPICLPTTGMLDILPGTNFTISGWGKAEKVSEEDVPETLKEGVLSTVDDAACFADATFNETNLCLVGEKETPCVGDSGGPIFSEINGTYYTFGVASASALGYKLCELNSSVIYVKLTSYLDWIQEQIGQLPNAELAEEVTTPDTTVTEQTT